MPCVAFFCELDCQADKKKEDKVEERVTLGPKVAEGENVFGVAHIFASFNDTFVVSAGIPDFGAGSSGGTNEHVFDPPAILSFSVNSSKCTS